MELEQLHFFHSPIKNRQWSGLKYKKTIISIIFAKYTFEKKIIHIKKVFILHAVYFGILEQLHLGYLRYCYLVGIAFS